MKTEINFKRGPVSYNDIKINELSYDYDMIYCKGIDGKSYMIVKEVKTSNKSLVGYNLTSEEAVYMTEEEKNKELFIPLDVKSVNLII